MPDRPNSATTSDYDVVAEHRRLRDTFLDSNQMAPPKKERAHIASFLSLMADLEAEAGDEILCLEQLRVAYPAAVAEAKALVASGKLDRRSLPTDEDMNRADTATEELIGELREQRRALSFEPVKPVDVMTAEPIRLGDEQARELLRAASPVILQPGEVEAVRVCERVGEIQLGPKCLGPFRDRVRPIWSLRDVLKENLDAIGKPADRSSIHGKLAVALPEAVACVRELVQEELIPAVDLPADAAIVSAVTWLAANGGLSADEVPKALAVLGSPGAAAHESVDAPAATEDASRRRPRKGRGRKQQVEPTVVTTRASKDAPAIVPPLIPSPTLGASSAGPTKPDTVLEAGPASNSSRTTAAAKRTSNKATRTNPTVPTSAPVPGVAVEEHVRIAALDRTLHVRVAVDGATVRQYADQMKAGATFPRVDVFREPGTGTLYLANGFHRVAAEEQLGHADVRASVRVGDRREATLFALQQDRNLSRSSADKRRAVQLLLADPEWAAWSDRELGIRAGVDHKTVAKIRGELGTMAGPRKGRDGKVRRGADPTTDPSTGEVPQLRGGGSDAIAPSDDNRMVAGPWSAAPLSDAGIAAAADAEAPDPPDHGYIGRAVALLGEAADAMHAALRLCRRAANDAPVVTMAQGVGILREMAEYFEKHAKPYCLCSCAAGITPKQDCPFCDGRGWLARGEVEDLRAAFESEGRSSRSRSTLSPTRRSRTGRRAKGARGSAARTSSGRSSTPRAT